MILIAHRGNTEGRLDSHENEPTYIDLAIKKGFDVEVDVWYKDNQLWLGHDAPQYGVDFRWLRDRQSKLWVHCKNTEAVVYLNECGHDFNYFWHQEDDVTLTSKGHIWAYPGKQPIRGSIAVMPEIKGDDVSQCAGVCSDNLRPFIGL